MGWIWQEDQDHDYRFLRSGELEFRGRGGRYHIVSGCSVAGIFELDERFEEIRAIAQEAPGDMKVGELYEAHPRFRYLCDRILELNGVELDWVTPREMSWLIFARMEAGQIIQPPLQTLNRPPKPRHPGGDQKSKGVSDRVSLIAAIASHCGGNLNVAYDVAQSKPFRELMAVMEESNWLQKTPEERRKAEFKDWAKSQREAMRAKRGAIRNCGSGGDRK